MCLNIKITSLLHLHHLREYLRVLFCAGVFVGRGGTAKIKSPGWMEIQEFPKYIDNISMERSFSAVSKPMFCNYILQYSFCSEFEIYNICTLLYFWKPIWKPRKARLQSGETIRNAKFASCSPQCWQMFSNIQPGCIKC